MLWVICKILRDRGIFNGSCAFDATTMTQSEGRESGRRSALRKIDFNSVRRVVGIEQGLDALSLI